MDANHEQLDEWRDALRRSEKGVVVYAMGGCRAVLRGGKVLSQHGTPSGSVERLEIDSRQDRMYYRSRDCRKPGFHDKLREVEALTEV